MIKAEIPQDAIYAWESLAAQQPPRGGPGIVYHASTAVADLYPDLPPVDMLLYYHTTKAGPGFLVAILSHYPVDYPPLQPGAPFEKAGAVNVWVKPNQQGKGFARILWLEAVRRWGIDWRDSRYTPEGARAVAHHYDLEIET